MLLQCANSTFSPPSLPHIAKAAAVVVDQVVMTARPNTAGGLEDRC